MTIEKTRWFKIGILSLSVLSASLLFSWAEISMPQHQLFSAVYLVYLFCLLGFERFYSAVSWFLLLLINPKLVSAR